MEEEEDKMEESESEDETTSLMDKDNKTTEMLFENNYHISLFGEIIQDGENQDQEPTLHPALAGKNHEEMGHKDHVNMTKMLVTKTYRNVSELLFHPANFKVDIKT